MNRYILVTATILLSSCATAHQERSATQGAVIGGAAGAIIGAQSDQIVEGAIIGGVLGGLAGAILAQDRDDRIYASEERYHRSSCSRGDIYFDRARHTRDLGMRVSLLRQGIRYCPNNPAAHNDLGVALMLWGDSAGARIHFGHALRLDPQYYPARRNMDYLGHYQVPRHRAERYREQRQNSQRYEQREDDRDGYRQNNNQRGRQEIQREGYRQNSNQRGRQDNRNIETRQNRDQRDRQGNQREESRQNRDQQDGKYRDRGGDDEDGKRRERDRRDD
ncbi:MAG: hypothetical protein AUJ57_01310 [Zetaproteobacteria bacterium CG1_02_53_45]|nr:MAG: hypothetical protein AUJ57_01310 [Zetaproteobacteria bacterium CG1_02_53_45]